MKLDNPEIATDPKFKTFIQAISYPANAEETQNAEDIAIAMKAFLDSKVPSDSSAKFMGEVVLPSLYDVYVRTGIADKTEREIQNLPVLHSSRGIFQSSFGVALSEQGIYIKFGSHNAATTDIVPSILPFKQDDAYTEILPLTQPMEKALLARYEKKDLCEINLNIIRALGFDVSHMDFRSNGIALKTSDFGVRYFKEDLETQKWQHVPDGKSFSKGVIPVPYLFDNRYLSTMTPDEECFSVTGQLERLKELRENIELVEPTTENIFLDKTKKDIISCYIDFAENPKPNPWSGIKNPR